MAYDDDRLEILRQNLQAEAETVLAPVLAKYQSLFNDIVREEMECNHTGVSAMGMTTLYDETGEEASYDFSRKMWELIWEGKTPLTLAMPYKFKKNELAQFIITEE